MKTYTDQLDMLKTECGKNFENPLEDASDDAEYKRIRSDALDLLEASRGELSKTEYLGFKRLVIEFLCSCSGCNLDLEVLEKYTPRVLTEEDYEDIKTNSALARWF